MERPWIPGRRRFQDEMDFLWSDGIVDIGEAITKPWWNILPVVRSKSVKKELLFSKRSSFLYPLYREKTDRPAGKDLKNPYGELIIKNRESGGYSKMRMK